MSEWYPLAFGNNSETPCTQITTTGSNPVLTTKKKLTIMTPKEKAEDLINKFAVILMDEDTDCGNEILCTSIAIKNALICVDEILNVTSNNYYWLKVSYELEKL